MPLNKDIKKVLVIGSGPIVIGQAAEFDYAGTQACRALKEDGIEIVLVNSNPATIMTDNTMADKIYIEALTIPTIKRIIEKEKPDSILSGFGGQTGLTLSMQLAKEGFLEKNNVRLLGASPETIDKAEDRQIFKDTMESIGQPCIPSKVVTTLEDAVEFAEFIGYPVIIRPAFTLGGSGGGIAENIDVLKEIAENGLALSPITQILVEKSIAGWKEIEFEVIRDAAHNVITVCSMENFDPVGIHTGDSIVIAPAVTLSDKEYQMLRTASLNIVETLGVEGGCNVQLALHPTSFEYAVIEVNPRVSRSSALASKATGYPIAKVAAKIAIGYNLDEIINSVTGTTYASFEPALDYVALKFPKWPFDKFVYAKRNLGTQMKATGEVMSIADNFEAALMKAVRGAEISLDTLDLAEFHEKSDEFLWEILKNATDQRLFAITELLRRKVTIQAIHDFTMIDIWFLSKLQNILDFEDEIRGNVLTEKQFIKGKKYGFTNKSLEKISGNKINHTFPQIYKTVDTCAAEFAAKTPYFYGSFAGKENEVLEFTQKNKKETVIVLGSGPIRIGQGIEFDYASVHCVHSLQKLGYEVVIINNNPETVSTDFDTANRLYFEPLCPEDVMNIIEIEKPIGVVVAFGGQTAIKLTKTLSENNVRIIGTSADSIDAAEDRERFEALLEKCGIKRPKGSTVMNSDEAIKVANDLTYPVLMRPSYVLGGQNMIIAYNDDDIREYMKIILSTAQDNPVLIDKYLSGKEIEVDAICDGENILIPGIMEHIERTGVHSGDSIAVYPAFDIDKNICEKILITTEKICTELKAIGLINLQYIIANNEIYVIEVNPRASRTVPYISKITGVPMCDLATKVSLGFKLKDMEFGTGIYKSSPFTAVKVPVFSFEKLTDVDTQLGPEMKSTGEVLGIGNNLQEALYKGLVSAGYNMCKTGGVFITVRDSDKAEIAEIARKFEEMGFVLYSTSGTADILKNAGLAVNVVDKIHENPQGENTLTLLESKKLSYVISTSARGRNPQKDSVKIRRKACLLGIPSLTSIDTANALADSLMSRYNPYNTDIIDINNMKAKTDILEFTKMQGAGNDYIYFNCMEKEIENPLKLSQKISDRNFGIGGDGIVMILPSKIADARMRMFNTDGSEGKMCGNAIRCVAKYLYDNKIVLKNPLTVETLSGIKTLFLNIEDEKVKSVKVDMGSPILEAKKIPVKFNTDKIIKQKIEVAKKEYEITCVSMGNPHCVVFCEDVANLNLREIGKKFEGHYIFPESVNTEFVKVIDKNTLEMRVWERGSGETLACGTGACASAVAAVLNGFCNKNEDITIKLLGGDLVINYTDDTVFMTGPCEIVFNGTIEV